MAKKFKPLNSVLIKPSGPDCNLNCSYCFYLEKSELFAQNKTHRMSPQVQEETIRQVMQQSGENVSLAWQGGEPTLMGLEFYERAIELEKKYGHGQMVGNGLQTNGLLLNRDWAKFLKKYDWLVGLSLDGPQFIHDHYRFDVAGKGTHQRVEDRAKMLLDEGVSVNAMCCVTSHSVKYPEELYNYYKEMGLTFMQFIPVVETDKNDPTKAADFSVSAEAYGHFLNKLFDLWLADFKDGQPTTSIRHFESVFYTYVGLEAPECTMMKECGPYVVVEHNGNVYSCDFFVEPKWKLGNVMHDRIINMLNSKKQTVFGMAKTQLPRECKQCSWLTKCYGGCTKDRIKDPRDQRKPRFCTAYKLFFNHADPTLSDMAVQWQQNQHDMQQSQQSGGVYNAFDDFMK
ncbi:anaerobic sulfatase maturase [uncultured Sunxiuqinia sp.]|uniref:anaerobic sulfatase maturase n=1 Tax=Sunxiuqinia rutila TaxID=1397841 RepID=UPI0026279796|nr:anaerobic sulfatase maturase [uncultured Sunxiuqinia sp.]